MDEKELLKRLLKEAEERPTLKEFFLSEYNAATNDEARAMIIESLLGWAGMRQWGWDALVELVAKLVDRGEPVPPRILKDFVVPVLREELKRGKKGKKDDERNQVRWTVRTLKEEHGYSSTKAYKAVAGATNASDEKIRKTCDDTVRPIIRLQKGERGYFFVDHKGEWIEDVEL